MSRDPVDPVAEFESHRAYLFGLAYRMLGTVADAEDAVQEAFLRWHRCATADIECPRAWLTTVTTRLCLNHLNSARVQREQYVGPWLPEPLVENPGSDPRENAVLADSLATAFTVVLESLSPIERAVFVLREVFGYDFAQIALAVEKTEDNCRQILTRARQRVAERRPRFDTNPSACEAVVERFLKAVNSDDVDGLLVLLAPDAKLVADGGGRVGTAGKPIETAEPIARFLAAESRKHRKFVTRGRRLPINGQPGVLYYVGPFPVAAVSLNVEADRVSGIYIVANPEKLTRFMSWPVRLMSKVIFRVRR